MIICCDSENTFYNTLVSSNIDCRRCDNPRDGLYAAREGEALLLLADNYPAPGCSVDEDFMNTAAERSIGLYIEYPSSLPGLQLGEPGTVGYERAVVSSDFFAPLVERYTILAQHGCWFLPADGVEAHISVARVAGYDKAVYGLPRESYPLLFEMPGYGSVMVAVTCLSGFIDGRYGPAAVWKRIWERLLSRLEPSIGKIDISWLPAVDAVYAPNAVLPDNAEVTAFNRCIKWMKGQGIYSTGGRKGVTEGFESAVDHRGRQMRRAWLRSDCISETGMMMACDWAVNRNPLSRRLAGEMLDYVWSSPDFLQTDPDSPAYGMVNWFEKGPVFYSDDNARVIISTLAAGRLLKESRWDKHVIRCLLANLRTTGVLGFRPNRLDYPISFTDGKGWSYYHQSDITNYCPHHQAYLWAAYLWAYALTGHEEFHTKTVNAMRMTMDAYPSSWRWTNGITQEIARMLLPLAWLVRIDGRDEYRSWLNNMAGELLKHMHPCGAVQEAIGKLENGVYPPPQSNEAYGTKEAPLIQQNGDPSCDLLYTQNFAFMGMHEAACATGDAALKQAEDAMAEFLCRVQVKSTSHPELDGAWMRGFDFELWEYWGSSADNGWGAWCIETGWTNTLIASTMAMRRLGISFLDFSASEGLKTLMPGLLVEMSRESGETPLADKTIHLGARPGAE